MLTQRVIINDPHSLSPYVQSQSAGSFWMTAPNVLYSYNIMPSFFILYKSLKYQNEENAWFVIKHSLGFTALIYFVALLTPLVMFGGTVNKFLFVNLATIPNSISEFVFFLFFIIMSILHIPLIFFVAKEAVITIYLELKNKIISEDKALTSSESDKNEDEEENVFTKYIKKDINISSSLNWKEYYPITILVFA